MQTHAHTHTHTLHKHMLLQCDSNVSDKCLQCQWLALARAVAKVYNDKACTKLSNICWCWRDLMRLVKCYLYKIKLNYNENKLVQQSSFRASINCSQQRTTVAATDSAASYIGEDHRST